MSIPSNFPFPNYIYNTLNGIADNSEFVGGSNHAAAITYKNRIITTGTNKSKTHPIAFRFSQNPEKLFLHAEMDAITKFIRNHDEELLKKCTLYVARFGSTSTQSKPCEVCQRMIDYYSISNVIHT